MIDPTEADVGRRVRYHYRPHTEFHGWSGTIESIVQPHTYVRWDNGRAFHVMHCLLRWEP